MLSECQTRVHIIYFGENVAVIFSHKFKACQDGCIYYALPFLGLRLEVSKSCTIHRKIHVRIRTYNTETSPRSHEWRFVAADWGC